MVILDEKGLSGMVKKLLDTVLWGGIAIYIGLPFLLRWYMDKIYIISGENYAFLMIILYITGLPALSIVRDLREIFRTINRHNPFMMDNVHSLRRIAAASFVISFAYIFKIIFYNSFLTIIITMLFVIAGLFSVILAEVFKQAVEVKEENDLTI